MPRPWGWGLVLVPGLLQGQLTPNLGPAPGLGTIISKCELVVTEVKASDCNKCDMLNQPRLDTNDFGFRVWVVSGGKFGGPHVDSMLIPGAGGCFSKAMDPGGFVFSEANQPEYCGQTEHFGGNDDGLACKKDCEYVLCLAAAACPTQPFGPLRHCYVPCPVAIHGMPGTASISLPAPATCNPPCSLCADASLTDANCDGKIPGNPCEINCPSDPAPPTCKHRMGDIPESPVIVNPFTDTVIMEVFDDDGCAPDCTQVDSDYHEILNFLPGALKGACNPALCSEASIGFLGQYSGTVGSGTRQRSIDTKRREPCEILGTIGREVQWCNKSFPSTEMVGVEGGWPLETCECTGESYIKFDCQALRCRGPPPDSSTPGDNSLPDNADSVAMGKDLCGTDSLPKLHDNEDCHLICSTNYHPNEETRWRCAEGEWVLANHSQTPECLPNLCDELPADLPDHSNTTAMAGCLGRPVGDTCTQECEWPWQADVSPGWECINVAATDSGTYTPTGNPPATCTLTVCGSPPAQSDWPSEDLDPDAAASCNGTANAGACPVTCLPGYVLANGASLVAAFWVCDAPVSGGISWSISFSDPTADPSALSCVPVPTLLPTLPPTPAATILPTPAPAAPAAPVNSTNGDDDDGGSFDLSLNIKGLKGYVAVVSNVIPTMQAVSTTVAPIMAEMSSVTAITGMLQQNMSCESPLAQSLQSLAALGLDYNQFQAPVPDALFRSMDKHLTYLFLAGQQWECPLPQTLNSTWKDQACTHCHSNGTTVGNRDLG
eukprot:gene414-2427_t